MKSNQYVSFLILLVLVSCSTPQDTISPQSTSTIIPNTSISQPTPTETSTETSIPHDISNECVPLSNTKLTGSGYLLMYLYYPESVTGIYDMHTVTLEEKREDIPDGLSTSPQGNAFIYWKETNDSVFLLVAKTEKKTTKTSLKDRPASIDWVNDHLITLENQPGAYTVFLDPYTGEKKRIDTDFPDMYGIPDEINKLWNQVFPVFDPSLEYAVYPGSIVPLFLGVRLIRTQDKTVVGQYETVIDAPPRWSSDGESFIVFSEIDNKYELIRVFKDGTVNVLTDLHLMYPDYWLSHYRWSPDGKRIAAWFSTNHSWEKGYLAIIDLENYQTKISCIDSRIYFTNFPFWSPDSNQLIVSTYPDGNFFAPRNIVIDVDNMSYFILDAEQALPLGWLTFKPDRK